MKKFLFVFALLLAGLSPALAQSLIPYAEITKKYPNDPNSLDLIITFKAARNPTYKADTQTGIGTYNLTQANLQGVGYAGFTPPTGDNYVPGSKIENDHFNFHITDAIVDESMQDVRLTSGAFMFSKMPALKTIKGMEYLNTSEMTDMQYMFSHDFSLESIDLSHFNTSKVTNMWAMFQMCRSLTALDVSTFETSNVTNMMLMFSQCEKVTTPNFKFDPAKFKTDKVTTMFGMFQNMSSLTSIDVSSFNVNNVTDFGSMFRNCKKLESLDISKWAINTKNVTSIRSFAEYCKSLTELNLGANSLADISSDRTDAFFHVGDDFPCHITFTFDRSKLYNLKIDKTNPLPPYYNYYFGRFYIAEKLDCDKNLAEDYTPVAKARADLWQPNRALTTNDWNTLVVPVALTREQLEQSFGTGVQVCRLVGYSGKTLHFKTVGQGESIPANEPVLVKPAEDIKNIGYANVDIKVPTNNLTKETEESSEKKAYLIGSYKSKITLDDTWMYYSPSYHYFIRSNGNAVIRKTRAYLKLSDHPTAALSVAIDDNGISTNINSIDGAAIGQPDGPAYNLSGQRVGDDYKGIVIVNGKKLLRK